jgi:hypothetical protein
MKRKIYHQTKVTRRKTNMGLGKKNSKEAKAVVQQPKTVAIQTVVPAPEGEKKPSKNGCGEWGYKYINGKKLVVGIISEIPAFCSGFSAGHDIIKSIETCRKSDVSKKDKTACVFKTIGKVALKGVTGVVASRCVYDTIRNTVDLSDKK